MTEIDFHLGCTVLMNQGIHVELLRVREVVHVLDEIFKLSHGIDTEG